jgi:hypothetical protein
MWSVFQRLHHKVQLVLLEREAKMWAEWQKLLCSMLKSSGEMPLVIWWIFDELKFWFRSWHVGTSRVFCDHSDEIWELQQVRRTWTHWLTRQYAAEALSHFNAAESASHIDLMKSEDVHLLLICFPVTLSHAATNSYTERLLDNHHKPLFHLTEATLKAVLLMWKHTWALSSWENENSDPTKTTNTKFALQGP